MLPFENLDRKFPASKKLLHVHRQVITLDSRNRVNFNITSPNNYTVQFPALSQVVGARLVGAEIPNSQYTVNIYNNVLDFDDVGGGTGVHSPALNPGSYTPTQLSTEIDRAMNNALGLGPGVNFTASVDSITRKVTINRIAGGNFSLLWSSGPNILQSAAQMLGFRDDVVNVTTTTAPYVLNIAGENYVYLCIPRFESGIKTTESIHDIFAKIVINVPPNFICCDSFVTSIVEFPQPIATLKELKIKFIQQNGKLYDFNGVDHSMSIEFYVNT